MFLTMLELAMVLGLGWFFITQIIVPISQGKPMLPAMRKRAIEARLEHAREEVDMAHDERELDRLKRKTEKIKYEHKGEN